MIDGLRKERAQLRKEMAELRKYIETHPNRDLYQGSRAKLRWLLNQMALKCQGLTEKIVAYEDEERLTNIFKDLSGRTDQEARSLMKYMEKLQMVKAG